MIVCLGTTPTVQRTMAFERLGIGDVNRAAQVHEYASGKSVNAARVLHTLGRNVLCLGIVGGLRGQRLRDDLDKSGIRHDFLDVPTPTRLCVTVLDRATRSATELVEEAGEVAPDVADALLAKLQESLEGAKVLVLSGSLAKGLRATFYAEAVELAKAHGVQTVLDARGEPLRAAIPVGPSVVKPNRSELAATVGRPVDSRNAMLEAMRVLVTQGAGAVVVTRGRDGASVCEAGSNREPVCLEVTTPKIDVISPIGSGDAFAAGLAVGLADGMGFSDACRLASACGAANAMTPHAGHLSADDVNHLALQVQVRAV